MKYNYYYMSMMEKKLHMRHRMCIFSLYLVFKVKTPTPFYTCICLLGNSAKVALKVHMYRTVPLYRRSQY